VGAVRVTLYVLGAAFELLGILMLAAPDFVPGAIRIARWTLVRWRPFENRIRQLLHLPGRGVVVTAGAAGGLALTGRASGVTSIDSEATLHRKVEFLLQRDQEAQRAENRLAEQVADLEAELARHLGELRGAMEAHVARELTSAQKEYRLARIGGTLALIIGLAVTAGANFVV
jgi:hypothetical protein